MYLISMFRKKVLITGGAGFIGSHLATELVKQGAYVIVVDNEFSGNKKNLEDAINLNINPETGNLEYIVFDIKNKSLNSLIKEKKPEIVFHQAAITSVPRSILDPELTLSNNINGTLNLLLACKEAKVRRVLFASSSSVYGDNPNLPKKEESTGNPLSPYAVSKLTCEHLMKNFYNLYGMETVSIRYFNVFGPKQNPNSQYSAVIPVFIKRMMNKEPPIIFGDGEQVRDFTYIQNVVKGNILLAKAEKEKVTGKVFNIAYGGRISINDLVLKLNNILGTNLIPEYSRERKGEIKNSYADISRAREIGFEPSVSFEEGLEKTVEFYKKN